MNAPNVPQAPSTPGSSKTCPRCGGALNTYDKMVMLAVPVLVIFHNSLIVFCVVGILVAVLLLLPSKCSPCGTIPLREFPARARKCIIARKIFTVLLLFILLASAVAVLNALRQLNVK
jgi:hypothetical protein